MVTPENLPQLTDGTYSGVANYFGLTTDDMPTGDDVANGSRFIEMDSGKIYLYDAEGAQWLEWGA